MIRHLGPDDVDPAVAVLGAAFSDDPLLRWVYPAPRGDDVGTWMRIFVEAGRRRGHAYAVVDGGTIEAVAVWSPPGIPMLDDADSELLGETLLRQPERVEMLLAAFEQITAHHPEEPHFYLSHLGVDPSMRSGGRGGRLVAHVLEICDREGWPAYLESSNPRNVGLYERHGFSVTAEVEVEPGGPVVRPMWRAPGRP